MDHLKLLVKAHKDFNEAMRVFEACTGLDTIGRTNCVQLYGSESCDFLRKHGGLESNEMIILNVDEVDVICLKNI